MTDDENGVSDMYDNASNSPLAGEQDDTESDQTTDDGDKQEPALQAPLLGGESEGEPESVPGTFYVKFAQESAATLHEVNTAQICTLSHNPGLETHQIIEATLVAQPPMELSYVVDDLVSQRTIPVERSPEPPTTQVRTAAKDMEPGQAVAIEREGEGEIHILRVEPDETDSTAEELLDDEMPYKNAARYDVERVEIRTEEDTGTVSVRYLP